MTNIKLNHHGQQLVASLRQAEQYTLQLERAKESKPKVHVAGAGGAITAAYEQLRNAAEYAEEHLLLTRAIRRFYRRLFVMRDSDQIAKSGEELVVELTLAGYLPNDSVLESTVKQINGLGVQYFATYETLGRDRTLPRADVEKWTLDVLAVRAEWLLTDHSTASAYVQFVYDYLLGTTDFEAVLGMRPADLETALYVAVQRALLKSDMAVVRAGLLDRYQQSPENLRQYTETNQQIDILFASPTIEKLFRFVDRRGAPFRILKRLMDEDDTLSHQLAKKDGFLHVFEAQVGREYQTINTRINRGIIKSVIFLVITKFLIGLAIEVPYDLVIYGRIAWTALLINFAFPPIYMILLRMTLILPGPANTKRLCQQIEHVLYGQETKQLERRQATNFGMGYNIAYALAFVVVFGGVGYLLWQFAGFEIVHLLIFFIFLSGASFLGFRLSRMIREIEAVNSSQNAVTTVRDFLYTPFVVVGRFMSEKYAQVNLVALILDMVIELPLKTILRLVRQWAAFISSKQDQL